MALIIKYYLIAFFIGLAVVLFNIFSAVGQIHSLGQGAGVLFWMVIGPGTGMVAGAVIRQWLMPDAIMTGSTGGLFKAKIFWLLGPQFIGWMLGLLAVGNHLN